MIAQDKRDTAMDGLLAAMNDLYAFVAAADQLEDMDKDRKKLLKDMFVQTAECAYFIRDKAQVESFCEYIIFYVAAALRSLHDHLQGPELEGMPSAVARSITRSPNSHKCSSTSAVSSPSEGCSQSSSSLQFLMISVRLQYPHTYTHSHSLVKAQPWTCWVLLTSEVLGSTRARAVSRARVSRHWTS